MERTLKNNRLPKKGHDGHEGHEKPCRVRIPSISKVQPEFRSKIKTEPRNSNRFYKTWENATER